MDSLVVTCMDSLVVTCVFISSDVVTYFISSDV